MASVGQRRAKNDVGRPAHRIARDRTCAHFTTAAVVLAVENAIDIVILADHGAPIARIVPSTLYGQAAASTAFRSSHQFM